MNRIFADTNIIIDLIADRRPYSKFAAEIFRRAEGEKIKVYVSSHSIATTYYLLKKYSDEKELRGILQILLEFVRVVPVDSDILKKGLKSRHKDFEDALQMQCAYSVEKMDCIVTRNLRDFRGCELVVLSPEELCGQF